MSGHFNISQFLQAAKDEGDACSEGSFTISLENAKKKLAKFALPSGEAWVSKLLQAVVGWKVKLLRVRQLKDVTIFHFQPSVRYGIPKAGEIWNCFLNGNIGGHEPLQRFCLALHALREQEGLSFLLILAEEGIEPAVFADGVHLDRDSQKQTQWTSFIPSSGLTLAISHFNDQQRRILGYWSNAKGAEVRRRAGIAACIQQSALGYPLALELDSRRLDKIEFRGLRHNHILAIRPIRNRESKGDLLLPVSLFAHLENEKISGALRREPHCLGLLLLCHTNVASRGRCLWVDDGVVLERHEMSGMSRLSVTLLVSAARLPTDLTGLRLTQSKEWKDRHGELSRQTEQIFSELGRNATHLYHNLPESERTGLADFTGSLAKLLRHTKL